MKSFLEYAKANRVQSGLSISAVLKTLVEYENSLIPD